MANPDKSALYYSDVMNEYEKINKNNSPQKDFMTKQWVDIMIERIVAAEAIVKKSGYFTLHETVKTTLRTYLVDTTDDGKKTLVLKPVPGKQYRSKTVIPLEETYEVVQTAHLRTNHGTCKEMEAWLANNNYLLHLMCCSIYIQNCDKCSEKLLTPKQQDLDVEVDTAVKNITNEPEPIFKPISPIPDFEFKVDPGIIDEEYFECVCSVDVLDISNNPDHLYQFLLIYEDIKTHFIQLRPLNTNSESELCIELLKIVVDLGPPGCLVVDVDNINIFKKILKRLEVLAACNIALAFNKSGNKLVQRVVKNIIQWMKEHDCKNWGVGCHEVQWNMNNEPDLTGKTPFSRVFGSHYKGYRYKSKFVSRTAVNENSDDDDIINLRLVSDDEDESQAPDIGVNTVNSPKAETSNEDFLITITENIKTETLEPQVSLSNISTSQKLDSFQYDSDGS